MTTIETKISPCRPLRWTVFCVAIDNFGDIGVCWRLAQQLSSEFGAQVELWVDDWEALQWFLKPLARLSQDGESCLGVILRHWSTEDSIMPSEVQRIAAADVIVEAFACELPVGLVEAMSLSKQPPLWLNLEYLSAQDWVRDCHLLPSPQGGGAGRTLQKFFYFPGFVEGTGGLLREAGVIMQHEHWQQDLASQRAALLVKYALPPELLALPDVLLLSLFTYESPAVLSLLDALIESPLPTLCFVPHGRSLEEVARCFGLSDLPAVGSVLKKGSLSIAVLPFMSQAEYDQLLSLCDCNFVRGEDSFVRAQYAGRPLVWHIYPQTDDVHMDKLAAFLALYSGESAADAALKSFWQNWNQGEDCRDLWHYLRPQLPSLQIQARRWQQQMAEKPDLVTNLLAFYRAQRESMPA